MSRLKKASQVLTLSVFTVVACALCFAAQQKVQQTRTPKVKRQVKQSSKQPAVSKRKSDKETGKPVVVKLPPHLNQKELKQATIQASVFYYENLVMAHRGADAIVIGSPTQPFLQRTPYVAYVPTETERGFNESLIQAAWTVGSFRIDRVLYRNAQHGITELNDGQIINLAESVGIIPVDGGFARMSIEKLTELKHNSQYVVFLAKSENGQWGTCNVELGRFNTDGTDLDDSVGGRAWKEALRQELTAAYGVTFTVPTTVAPTITALSPNVKDADQFMFTLTVTGTDFKNGAVVKFGTSEKTTTFLSATQLTATIVSSDVSNVGTVPVTVINPDGQVSAASNFTVGSGTSNVSTVSTTWSRANGVLTATVLIKNRSGVAANDIRFTEVYLRRNKTEPRYDTTSLPLPTIAILAPGETKTITHTFVDSVPPGSSLLSHKYNYLNQDGYRVTAGGTGAVTLP